MKHVIRFALITILLACISLAGTACTNTDKNSGSEEADSSDAAESPDPAAKISDKTQEHSGTKTSSTEEVFESKVAKPDSNAAKAYEEYLKMSPDFERIKQDKDWLFMQYPSWVYFCWYYKWNIGFNDAAARFCKEHGYNGGVGDREWMKKHNIQYYRGHVAGKGDLYLRKKKFTKKNKKEDIPGTGVRLVPFNDTAINRMKETIRKRVTPAMDSDLRCAYALDDEISWGTFVKPCFWQIVEDKTLFRNWLSRYYAKENVPDYKGWAGYNDFRKKLSEWSLKDFDCAQVMDQLTFNDAFFANLLGDLSEYSNEVDPAAPCGFVGGQAPNTFGGYDYARLMRKVQFIESYNIGGSQAVMRSLNPRNAVPMVTTHFHKNVKDTVWQAWYYIAQGNRGMIGWVEGWFDGKKPKPFHDKLGPHYIEIGKKIGPLQAGSEWVHDGVAIYYSHPSIQMSWFLDAQAHGGTWRNRNGDHRLGTSHLCRKAWENMLRDEGVQFSYLSYVDMVRNSGVPENYNVLILPAAYCLSDIEAYHIKRFCEAGGTVIADFLPGVFDQHGRGRKEGAVLDKLFSVEHDMNMTSSDVFSEKAAYGINKRTSLWVEVDQDEQFYYKTYKELMTGSNDCIMHESGFNKAVRDMPVDTVNEFGNGTAVLMNLSPQWYNAYRTAGLQKAASRTVFTKHIKAADISPWVRITQGDEDAFGYEITYWYKDGRTILFLISNPEVKGSSVGGGNSAGLKNDTLDVTLEFTEKLEGVRNERTGEALPDGNEYSVTWTMNEAVVLSFKGHPHPEMEKGVFIK